MADFKLEQRVYCNIRSKHEFSETDIHAYVQKTHYNMVRLQNGSVDLKTGESLLKMMREPGALSQPPSKRKELLDTDTRHTVEELAQISDISL